MAFTKTNNYISGRNPAESPNGPEVLAARFEQPVLAADLVANNVGKIGILPSGCVPVDVHVDFTDLDSGAGSMVLQVGIVNDAGNDLSTDAADGGGYWGSTTAASGAAYQRLTPNGRGWAAVANDPTTERIVGVKVQAAPATPAAGTLAVTVFYRTV